MESSRYASRFITKGQIFASRSPDLQLKLSNVELSQGWETVPLRPTSSAPKKATKKATKKTSGSSSRKAPAKKTVARKKKP